MNNNKISVAIITKNEEANIERAINSVKWADEIVVCDTGSTDRTVKICQQNNCKVFSIAWEGFGKAKQAAVDKTSNNWVLTLDADEVVTVELQNDIKKILEQPKFNCYYIKRKSFYLGKEIKHCGWNNDYPKRLFDKRRARYNDDTLHESLIVEGVRGRIESCLLHYPYLDISHHFTKINTYSELAANKLIKAGKRFSIFSSVFFCVAKFINMYIIKLGFLDGKAGFILSFNSAIGVYLKYIKTCKTK
ncbi:MAG: glycosyltransferase family 2 protein [Ignavibacteriales bacterium]